MAKYNKVIPDEYIGKVYGRLTILKYDRERSEQYKVMHPNDIRHYFICQCNCPDKTIVSVALKDLKKGSTVSCGCYHREANRKHATGNTYCVKHGMYKTRLYGIWCHIKSRCLNPTNDSYFNYGGRGITVCDEWKNDFIAFYKWAISNGYSDNLSIDRIDKDGNYEPSNCRWADADTQIRNTRRNTFLTYTLDYRTIGKGVVYLTFVIHDWAKILNCTYTTLKEYLGPKRNGMSINEILDLCNSIGHGGGIHPIAIDDIMMKHMTPENLNDSIRDNIDNPSGNPKAFQNYLSKVRLRGHRLR